MKLVKNVLLVSNMYPSKKYPHYGVFVKNCEYILRNGGYSVDCVFMSKQDHLLMKVVCYVLFYLKAIFRGLVGKYDFVYVHYASHVKLIVQAIKVLRPNLIVIVNVHGNDIVPIGKGDIKNPARSRVTLRLCDYVVAPSEYFMKILTDDYGVKVEKIICSPSGGVNDKVFYPKNKLICRRSLGIEDNRIVVGFVSRLEEGKEWKTFLSSIVELLKKGINIYYIMIGEGIQSAECKEMIREFTMEEYGEVVSFVEQKKLCDYYNAFDVFCFPSIQESLGLVGLEAMACGVPSVVSRIPGILTYAKDGWNCKTVQPGDYVAFSKAIEDIIYMSDEEKKELISNEGVTAAEYASSRIAKRFLEKFVEINR